MKLFQNAALPRMPLPVYRMLLGFYEKKEVMFFGKKKREQRNEIRLWANGVQR